jgi:hypothetical protein
MATLRMNRQYTEDIVPRGDKISIWRQLPQLANCDIVQGRSRCLAYGGQDPLVRAISADKVYAEAGTPSRAIRQLLVQYTVYVMLTLVVSWSERLGLAGSRQCHPDEMEGLASRPVPRYVSFLLLLLIASLQHSCCSLQYSSSRG